MSIPENGWRFHPMLIGDVAEVAGEPRETIRTREKQGVYAFEERYGIKRTKGWKRYTDLETVIIAVHASLKRAIHDDELADIGSQIAGVNLIEEFIEDENGVPYFDIKTFTRDRFMFFWRDAKGQWTAAIEDVPTAAQEKNDELIQKSYEDVPAFVTVNFGMVLKSILLRILKIEVRNEEGKSKGAKS